MPTPTFPWHEVKRPPVSHEKREEMYRRELEDRAALYLRLGFGAKQAKQRLKAAVAWDFELHGRPKHATEVDRIVDAVYRRGGGSGPPTV
jgi:hypothetical protein